MRHRPAGGTPLHAPSPARATGRRRRAWPGAILLLALVVVAPASAQVLNFRNFTALDGLPASQILALHQGARHDIWIGTYAGLGRYNGADFRTWATPQGLASNAVIAIAEDVDGRLHVGSAGGGVCTLDGPSVTCLDAAAGLPHMYVSDIAVAADGRGLWLATHDGVGYVSGGRVQAYGTDEGVPSALVHRIATDARGEVWVAAEGGLARWDGRRFQPAFADVLADAPVHVVLDTRWGLMVASGARLFLARGDTLTELEPPTLALGARITDAAAETTGHVWIATQAGALHFDGTSFDHYTTANGLLFDQITRVRVDREGNVWFGTERGLSRLTPGPFRHYTEAEGLPNPFVRAITEDATGRLWLGTRDGIAVREGESLRVVDLGQELTDRRVFSLAALPDGGMLVGTRGGGLLHHDGERVRRIHRMADGLPGDIVPALLPDGEGGAWVGTSQGLARWREGRVERVEGPPLLNGLFVVTLAQDERGHLWIGARSGGVTIWDGISATRLGAAQGLTDQSIWAIARDAAGAMWIGTNGDGVLRVDPDDLTDIRRLTTADGLIDDFVWQVQPDSHGSLWLYTNRGLDRVSDDGIRHYGRGRGLLELEGSASASWLDRAGDLWFGTSVAVVRYTPELDVPAAVRPPVYVEGLVSGTDTLPKQGARVRAGDGVLKVRFASPTFRDETRVRYRYRLLGARDEWSEPTPERSIAYAGLAPGHYEFQVHAIDTDGQTSERPATIAFDIVPRLWQTWWFRLAALAHVLAALGAVIVGRIRAADAERVRLEAIVEQRTRELSDKNGALEREIGDRQAAEDALRLSQERLLEVVEHSTNMFYSHGADGVLTYLSPQSRRILGCEPEEAQRCYRSFVTDHPANAAGIAATRRALATGERQPPYELELRGSDGVVRWVEVNEAPVTRDGRAIRMVGSLTDITDAKRAAAEQDRLQLQLRQAQKMEAVGRLAGGIAHDFNNLLTAVVGNTEIVVGGLEPDDPLQEDLAQVRQAADRAASLVTQLLAFSRQQLIRRSTLDLNGIVADSARMLGRTLGTDVELHLELAADPLWIEGDQAQLEQVVINLALNARDSMPDGGRLVISTDPVELDGQLAQNGMENCVPDGCYAALRVIDTGHGMDPETARHAFEPFFTTKPLAKGTGLGLATVYGIVTQNGGAVRIESEPGRGTTFHVFLPRVAAPPAPQGGATAPDAGGGAQRAAKPERRARVLVVEDEPAVRRLVCRTLASAGYEVLEAEDGAVALSVSTGYAGVIDLLLTDMIMPGLNGREVAECITASRSTTRVLYMSGHTNEMLGSRFMLDESTQVLEKPFAPDDLIRRVRATLA